MKRSKSPVVAVLVDIHQHLALRPVVLGGLARPFHGEGARALAGLDLEHQEVVLLSDLIDLGDVVDEVAPLQRLEDDGAGVLRPFRQVADDADLLLAVVLDDPAQADVVVWL